MSHSNSAEMVAKAHHHKTPNYFAVFLVLAVITALMTAIEYYDLNLAFLGGNAGKYLLFIILSIIKATLVVMYYMHLKFDSYVYTVLFCMPLALVMVLVVILAV